MSDATALVTRATIDEIEARRGKALTLYEQAFETLTAAQKMQSLATAAARSEAPSLSFGSYSRVEHFAGHQKDAFMGRARKEIDRGIWRYLIETTRMETLMDHKAREEFRRQLEEDPPEVTVENCYATLQTLIADSPMIFRRGVALAFSNLDRRFRSHDGFKIGARICLTHALSEWGSLNQRTREEIHDVERAFYVLQGQIEPSSYGGLCGAIDAGTRHSGLGRRAFVVETDLIRAKGYKNGNIHLWFLRDDLVDRVNQLLAEYYGEALGEGVDVAQPDHVRSTVVARNMGYFPTPEEVCRKVLERVGTYRQDHDAPLTVLEPSAGDGRMAKLALAAGCQVTCVELHPGRASELRWSGLFAKVAEADFLQLTPDAFGQFDRVIMNPPFDKGLDMDHVRHAFEFVAPGGRLCAVMSAGTAYREDKRTEAFRTWADRFSAKNWARDNFEDLPAGSFAESGTMVNTCLLTLQKPK